jgi:hypothetical protein
MANLVPLHIDKDTGELVATRNPGIGGGAPPGGGGGDGAAGYLHIQGLATDVWTITHGQGSDLLLVQVFTATNDVVIPDEISIIDINTVEITFGTPTTGRAHIIFFDAS